MRRTTSPSRWLRAALAIAALSVIAARAGVARAEDQGQPWFPMIDPDKDPHEIYAHNALSLIRVGGAGWRVNRGVYQASVTRHDFYVTVGRGDLASSQSASQITSSALAWGGGAALIAGVFWVGASVSPGGLDPPATPGLVLMGGGGLAILASMFFDGPSVSQAEVESMIDRYNDSLRAHIEHETGTRKPGPVQARLPLVVPWTDGRTGVGLMTAATF